MTEHESFLAAIFANPQDDTPRLVYADWLEEHGENERAEFIRVQCELAAMAKGCPNTRERQDGTLLGLRIMVREACKCCRWCLLMKRRRELCDYDTLLRWSGLTDLEWIEQPTFDYRRGFVAGITLSCVDWLRHGPALVRSVPLERVTLTDVYPAEITHTASNGPSWIFTGVQLPNEIYALLWQPFAASAAPDLLFGFRTREQAEAGLSVACLAWARDAARQEDVRQKDRDLQEKYLRAVRERLMTPQIAQHFYRAERPFLPDA